MNSKTVLIIGPKGQLGNALHLHFTAAGLEVLAHELGESQWQEPDAVAGFIQTHNPGLILYTRALDTELEDNNNQPIELKILNNCLKACNGLNTIVVFLSSYQVFGGENKDRYDFNDSTAPTSAAGRALVKMENLVSKIERHLIVRFSWLIDPGGSNLFTRILHQLYGDEPLVLSKTYKGAPSWQGDAIWALRGVVQQLLAGAENWGVFHYCSEDHCSEWQFATRIKENLPDTSTVEIAEIAGDHTEHSAILSCRRIRNNFGVHPRSWREGLKQRIIEWRQDHG